MTAILIGSCLSPAERPHQTGDCQAGSGRGNDVSPTGTGKSHDRSLS